MPERRSLSSPPALAEGWLALAWVVGTPTAFSLIDSVLQLPVITPARLWFLVVAIALVVDGARRPSRAHDPIGRWMAAFLIAMTASLALTADLTSTTTLRSDVTLLVEGYVMAFVAHKAGRRMVLTPRRLTGLAWGLAGVGIYLAATGMLQYALGWDFVPARLEIVHPMRVVGPFGNGVYFGIVTSILLLVVVFVFRHVSGRSALAVASLAAGTLLAVTVMAKGRTPLLALGAALLFLGVKRLAPWRPAAAAAVTALVLVSAMTWRPQETFAPPERLSDHAVLEDASFVERATAAGPAESRIATLAIAANMAWHHPWFGLGFGTQTFASYKDQFFPEQLGIPREWADWPTVPHNEFFFVLVSAGLVGFVPFVGLHVTIWRRLKSIESRVVADPARPRSAAAEVAPFVRAAQIVVLVNAFFVDLVFFSYVLMLFHFLVGVADAEEGPLVGRQAGRQAGRWGGRKGMGDRGSGARCVLFLIHNLEIGGAQRAMVTLATEVERAGWRAVVCAWRRSGPLAQTLSDAGVEVVTPAVGHGGWRRIHVPGFLRRVLRRSGAEIVHAHMSDAAIWAAGLHRLADTPVLVTHHSPDVLDLGGQGGRLARAVRRRLLSRAVHRAWGNVAVSDEVGQALAACTGLSPSRIHGVSNGIHPPAATDVDTARRGRRSRNAKRFGGGGPTIVSTSRLAPEKGLETLVAAMPRLTDVFPGVRAVLVGDGPHAAALQRQARDLGVADHVLLPGAVGDVAPWMRDADIFVAASRFEGAPLAALEAMAWEIPIVASRVRGHVALLGDEDRGGLFEAGRPEALADAVVTTIERYAESEASAQRARRFVVEHHSASAMTREYLRLYDEMRDAGVRR